MVLFLWYPLLLRIWLSITLELRLGINKGLLMVLLNYYIHVYHLISFNNVYFITV